MSKANIGMIGLAVMGENLTLNIESKGYTIAAYDIDLARTDNFIKGRAKNKQIIGTKSLEEFVSNIESPRIIMMMIKAGSPIDSVIESLLPLLDKGDIIIDGGNSYYKDTIRRTNYVESKELYFIGSGVSGGEEGALNGPSLMPGGSSEAWKKVKDIFVNISAKTSNNEACVDWIGKNGAGHFVKMVHNGIEYGDIQLITEVYHIMRENLNMGAYEIGEVFDTWNKGKLDSYLIDITAKILKYKDVDGSPLIDKILDTAGQKGTGKWTAVDSLIEGVPLSIITESVYARFLSSIKEERVYASKLYNKKLTKFTGNKKEYINQLENALYTSKIMSYSQGFALLRQASKEYEWNLNYGSIALLWRGGCIIRSIFLDDIKNAFTKDPSIPNLMIDDVFKSELSNNISDLRTVVANAVLSGVPVPALSASISYFDGYTTEKLPANLLQAQRDFFGAHTYERLDKPRGEFFHTNWTGKGGTTSSTTYNV